MLFFQKKIDDEKLIEYVKAHPDYFLSEIAQHFGLTLQAIFYALKRLKIIPFMKNNDGF